MNAVTMAANEVTPTDTADVDGTEITIDYGKCKAYEGTTEIANLEDIECANTFPEEAVKALLVERVRNTIKERKAKYEDEDDYE